MDELDHCFSVIALSETLLNPYNVSNYGITGYNHAFRTRYTGGNVAVSLFVSEKTVFSEMTDLCMVNDYTESLFIKISNDAMPLVIGLIDRPPNSNIVQLTKNLNDTFVQVSHMPCYVIGDCNVDFLKMTSIFWLKIFLKPCIQTLYYQRYSNQPEKQLR